MLSGVNFWVFVHDLRVSCLQRFIVDARGLSCYYVGYAYFNYPRSVLVLTGLKGPESSCVLCSSASVMLVVLDVCPCFSVE